MRQNTIATSINAKGIGSDLETEIRFSLKPANVNSGIVVRRMDVFPVVELHLGDENNSNEFDMYSLRYLVATLYSLGIDNVTIEVAGSELPRMGDTVQAFVFLVQTAGLKSQGVEKNIVSVNEAIAVSKEGSWIKLLPSNKMRLGFFSQQDREENSISVEHNIVEVSKALFISQICRARSQYIIQSLLKEVPDENIQQEYLLKELRIRNILDILADMAMLGAPLKADYIGFNVNQSINQSLLNTLIKKSKLTRNLKNDQSSGALADQQVPLKADYELIAM